MNKGFTGQRLDATGLYYYNARYYDSTIGRFISPDTIVPDPLNPQSLNRYSYCLNNPLRYVDPSGHGGEDWSWVTPQIIDQYLIENWDNPEAPLTDYGRARGLALASPAPVDLFNNLGGKEAGIDSDWGDMLSRAEWGDTFTITTKEGTTERIQLVQGVGFVMGGKVLSVAALMYATTLLRDQGNIPQLKLYAMSTNKQKAKMKLDDGHKWWDKIKGIGELFGGIVLATAGSVAIFVGGVCAFVPGAEGLSPLLIPLGFAGADAGWKMSRDAVYGLSAGRHGEQMSVSGTAIDLAWDIGFPVPTSYGPWGWSLSSGLNMPP